MLTIPQGQLGGPVCGDPKPAEVGMDLVTWRFGSLSVDMYGAERSPDDNRHSRALLQVISSDMAGLSLKEGEVTSAFYRNLSSLKRSKSQAKIVEVHRVSRTEN